MWAGIHRLRLLGFIPGLRPSLGLTAQAGDSVQQLAPGADRQSEVAYVGLGQQWQQIKIDLLLGKEVRVFAETETPQPVVESGHVAGPSGRLFGRRPVPEQRRRGDRPVEPLASCDPAAAMLLTQARVNERPNGRSLIQTGSVAADIHYGDF